MVRDCRILFTGSIVAAAAVASLLICRRSAARASENEALLRRQEVQLTEMALVNQRLSNGVAQVTSEHAAVADNATELARLQAQASALRDKSNQLSQQMAQNRHSAGVQFFVSGDFNLLEHNGETEITFGGGPRASSKLNDARVLTAALRQYANEHQGRFPLSLDQVASYFPKPLEPDSPSWMNAPLSGTNDFELVFQGAQSDLTNVPPRRVALARERQPWPTADGKFGRVYGYADGAASTVIADDNFQSWDAQHIIPPQ
jgi:hypothetical protein